MITLIVHFLLRVGVQPFQSCALTNDDLHRHYPHYDFVSRALLLPPQSYSELTNDYFSARVRLVCDAVVALLPVDELDVAHTERRSHATGAHVVDVHQRRACTGLRQTVACTRRQETITLLWIVQPEDQ